MNKITLALGAVIAIIATLALTTAAMSVIQQAMAVSNSSSVGKDNPIQGLLGEILLPHLPYLITILLMNTPVYPTTSEI